MAAFLVNANVLAFAVIDQAFVDILLTDPASVARLAVAAIAVNLVNTLGIVKAGVRGTLVDINFAVFTIGTGLTVTLKIKIYS